MRQLASRRSANKPRHDVSRPTERRPMKSEQERSRPSVSVSKRLSVVKSCEQNLIAKRPNEKKRWRLP